MKNYKILLSIVVSYSLFSCKPKLIYVPVETTKIEFKDKFFRDSIYLHDSIFIKSKGDTIWLEKYRYLYRDKLVRDSVYIQNSIDVPYPVEIKGDPIPYVSGWQNFQIWIGRGVLLLLVGYWGIRFLIRRFKW